MHKYLSFDIEAIDNLKLGKFERDPNNEYTYSYIPGSVIKGAIIWKMVYKFGGIDKKIINGDTIFNNAYPIINNLASIPMMECYGGDKQTIKSKSLEIEINNFFMGKEENMIPYRGYEFTVYDDSKLLGYTPKKVENMHINKKASLSGDDIKLFRYEAIAKGENFRGYIKTDENYAETMIDILKEEIMYFGGSRGSGYGKCKITNIKYLEENSYKSDFDIDKNLYIYFLSDAILYYEGKVNSYIPEKELRDMLDIKGCCKYVESFASLTTAASFNSLYNTNTICYTAVSKGSIIKYKVNEKVSAEKIKELTIKGVGLRREDGYGQIAILKDIKDKITITKYISNNRSDIPTIPELNKEDEELLIKILKNIYYKKIELEIELMIIDSIKNKEESGTKLASQVGKLMDIFKNANTMDDGSSFKVKLKEYLEHMQGKKGKKIWHELTEIEISNEKDKMRKSNLQRLLIDFVNDQPNFILTNVEKIICEGKVALGKYYYPNELQCNSILLNAKIKFLLGLFKYYLNLKEGKL